MTRRSGPGPKARPRRAGLSLALVVLAGALAGCQERRIPPPTFSVFSLTDKFFDVQALGDGNFLALGYRTKVLRSSDAGATWAIVHDAIPENMTRFELLDDKRGVGVGHGGLVFRTTDAGKTWEMGSSGDKYALFDIEVTGDTVFGVGDKSTLVRSNDVGKTWTATNVPIFVEGEPTPAGVRADMTLAIEDPIFYGVEFLDDQTGWIVGEYGQIRHTTDGGETWAYQHGSLLGQQILYTHATNTPPIRDIMTLPTFFHIRFRDPQNGIAVGTYGAIIVTSDGGETWSFRESPVKTPLYEIQLLPDGDALITGSSGVLLRGNTEAGWKPADLPPGIYTWLASVDVDEKGRGVAAGGYGTILVTEDFGKTWNQTSYQ